MKVPTMGDSITEVRDRLYRAVVDDPMTCARPGLVRLDSHTKCDVTVKKRF